MRLIQYQGGNPHFLVNKEVLLSAFVYIVIVWIGYQVLPPTMQTTCVLYYGVVSISYLLLVIAQPHRVGGKVFKLPLLLSGGLMWWLLGFRDISGVDDESYYMIFDQVATMSSFRWIDFLYLEPGYLFYFSLDFLFKAKLKEYILSIVLIATIHYSCIIMLIFFLFWYGESGWKRTGLLF